MAKVSIDKFTPGAQQPSKYIKVGPNYLKWGEQPGYYYVPQTDQYYIDQKQLNQQLQDQGVIDKPPGKPSLGEAIAPVAGAAAALYGGKYIGEHAGDWISNIGSKGGGLFSSSAPAAASSATNAGLLGAGVTEGGMGFGTTGIRGLEGGPALIGGQAGVPGLQGGIPLEGGQIPGTQAPGGLFSVGSTSGNILGGAGIGLGAYTAYQGIKEGNPIESGLGGLGIAGGISQLGYAIPGWGWAAAIGVPIIASLFSHHESTRDVAKKHTKSLMGMGGDDPQWQEYVNAVRAPYNGPPPDKSHPFFGKYANFNEYKAAGLDANDLSGVYGNLKTFGPDWAKYSQDQRRAVTQGIIDAGLYDSKKGEVIITNEDEAKKIRDNIMAGDGAVNAVKPQAPAPTNNAPAPVTATQPQYVNPVPKLPMQKPAGMMYAYNKG